MLNKEVGSRNNQSVPKERFFCYNGVIMKSDVVSVARDTPIYEAISTMVARNITGLPVVNDDMTLAGVITEKDVLDEIVTNFLQGQFEGGRHQRRIDKITAMEN